MGLSNLIDKLECDAPIEEITDTLRDDILEQVHSKYNNEILAAKSSAYKQAMSKAEQEGCAQAAQATKSYEANLMNTAKEQARLKADNERSKIAPRVDAEVAAEHSKFINDRRQALISQLDLLSLEVEKEFVLAAAAQLGLTLEETNQPAKKAKHDHCQARPGPTTPRGCSLSVSSNTSQTSHSKKRAYSPSVIEVMNPIPAREASTTPKPITTITFALKQESPDLNFTTPPTPSVICEAVDIAGPLSLTPGRRGLSSSIHNEANQMALDPESIDYRTIFPPGILAPPLSQSLPPRMSRTPAFGNEQAVNDGVNLSITPSAPPQDNTAFSLEALSQVINSSIQPLWAEIRKLEAKFDGGLPRAPPHAGPGYRAEFMHHSPAPKVSAVPATLLSCDSGIATQPRIQAADPFPLDEQIPQEDVAATTPTPLASAVCKLPRLDDEEFPALEQGIAPSTSRKKHTKGVVQRQWRSAAVVQQQQVKQSADQARAVQGRKIAGNQGPRPSLQDANLTEVTVIRFGGLEDEEEERKFRARNLIQIIQSVQRDLARQSKNPPVVLSGRWSQSAGLTSNFIYMLGGIIPPRNIVALKSILCSLFSGRTEIIPTKGWTWIQLHQVPTEDEDHCIWGPDDLLTAFRQNPCFQDTLICVQPHWQGNPLTSDKPFQRQCLLMESKCLEPKSSFFNAEIIPRYNSAVDVTCWVTIRTCHAANYLKEPSSVTNAAATTTAEITITNAMCALTR
ncbi:hypothetical protein V8E53_006809 [Lactarius tabidus]